MPDVLEPGAQPLGLLEDARGVGAGQPAVAGDHEDGGPLRVLRLRGQRVLDVGVRRHRRDGPGELAGVRRGGLCPLLRLDDPGRSDELHGARDLLHRLRRLDPRAVLAQGYGHALSPSSSLDDLLLVDVLVLERLVLLVAGLDRPALAGLELVEEVVVGLSTELLGLVLELLRVRDGLEDVLVRAAQEVEELLLEAEHVLGRHPVQAPGGAQPQRDRHVLAPGTASTAAA